MDDQKVPRQSESRHHLSRLMKLNVDDQLPDMDFPVNSMAEGRVLVPWEDRKYPNETIQFASGQYVCFKTTTKDQFFLRFRKSP